ncbi:endonuclease domain-containing protein [Paenibacillus periandrae]|uniref:endonuclease domain-containing protein n=1 Tax=Paenibacillus periandrae TaxID=1761741 RepID=UPI001F09F896|nr:endonuclease domain-containing protein [Paenibacillus periandrae]
MNPDFIEAYHAFLREHAGSRQGERLRRLTEGHGFAEKLFVEQVWWPAFGNFDNLHPEYEISDFRDGSRFLDFALLRNSVRLAIEIDGFGPHSQKISRSQFSDQWMRQNHLIIDGWKVLRFSYDDVKDRPRMCEQLIQQFMGKWFGLKPVYHKRISSEEKEIIRLAVRLHRLLTPKDVCIELDIEQQKARKLLHGLIEKGLLLPGGMGRKRIACYQLSKTLHMEELGL